MERANAILVHGAGGGGWEYDLWRPAFAAARFGFTAEDLQPASGGLKATVLEDYVHQVVDAAASRRGPIVLIGASMGGILALKVAERIPAAAVVLVNSVPPAGVGPARPAKRNPEVVRWANGPLQETRDAMPDSDEKTILWAWKRWRDESGAVMDALSAGVTARKPRCPALVVLGEKDTDIPYTTGMALAEWASADVHLYRGMSHVGPLLGTRAHEVAQAVVHWCRGRP